MKITVSCSFFRGKTLFSTALMLKPRASEGERVEKSKLNWKWRDFRKRRGFRAVTGGRRAFTVAAPDHCTTSAREIAVGVTTQSSEGDWPGAIQLSPLSLGASIGVAMTPCTGLRREVDEARWHEAVSTHFLAHGDGHYHLYEDLPSAAALVMQKWSEREHSRPSHPVRWQTGSL